MKTKLEIAFGLLDAIQSLELSPAEMSAINKEWQCRNLSLINVEEFYKTFLQRVDGLSGQLNALIELVNGMQKSFDEPRNTDSLPISVDVAPQEQAEADSPMPTASPAEDSASTAGSSPAKTAEVLPTKSKTNAKPAATKKKKAAVNKRKVLANPPKGYSKYGVRLGRKPREATAPVILPKTKEDSEDAAKKADSAQKSPPKSEKKPKTLPANSEPDAAYIASLQYGKEYDLSAVYLVNGFYVNTNQLLRGEAGVQPVGVIVPYVYQHAPGNILVSYRDEPLITVEKAEKYARSRKPFHDSRWRLKNAMDDILIKQQPLDVLNEMFKKMGGDKLEGKYIDGRNTYFGNTFKDDYKIRLVCKFSNTSD